MAGIVPLPPGAAIAGEEGIEYHPLLNPVVLERLFELTPFKLQDFKNFRLVSRAWSNLSLSKWRQNAWLCLTDKEQEENEDGNSDTDWMDVEESDDEEEVLPGISRQEYLQLLETDEDHLVQHPFRKYFLKNWKIDLQSVYQDGTQDQIRFWNRVGPQMTHLNLEKSNFTGVADVRTVIFESTPNLQCLNLIDNVYTTKRLARKAQRLDPKLPQHALIPPEQVQNNLTEFSVGLVEFRDDDGVNVEVVNYLPITWIELLIHFPNIKKIGDLTLGKETDLREFFNSVRVLRDEHGPRYLANLEDINLWPWPLLGGRLVSYINRIGFPLKRLTIAINQSVGEKTFMRLLQHPLEFLEVERMYCEDIGPFRNFSIGHKLLALKTLRLIEIVAPNLTFLKDCPNLEELIYKPFREDGLDADLTLGLRDVNFPKLEKLKDLWIMNNNLSTAEQIRRLSELMPNLKVLRIGLDNGSFRAVCEVWKELEKLTITPCRVREEALLGKDEQTGEKYGHPNLTDLTNLKTICMDFDGDQQGFTDAIIMDGILALPNLKKVKGSCLPPQISSHVRSQLQMKFPKSNIFPK